jgi:glycosyltransferase involved in cell wall biosynthesis
MKISIGSRIINSSWGGGNRFAVSLLNYLKNKNWEVTTNLKDKNIDIILMTEPRKTSQTSAYNQVQIARYLIKKPDTIVIHRINECDERKKTSYLNKYLVRANKVADHTIFISNFLENLFVSKGLFHNKNHSVIRNGADSRIFNGYGKKKWNGKSPVKVVTHHWGAHYNKGFDIYKELDLIDSIDGKKIEFSYIGQIPDNFRFMNCKVMAPLSGKELSKELKSNHIYITGSINEPAGMHHIEGAMCGLPLLFRNSGALPEYCKDFGVMFNGLEDFKEKFIELIENYEYYFDKLSGYPYNADFMCQNYEEIFSSLLEERKRLNLTKRRLKYLIIFIKEIGFFIKDEFLMKFRKVLKRYFGRELKMNYN